MGRPGHVLSRHFLVACLLLVSWGVMSAVVLSAELQRFTLAAGTPHETEYFVQDSGKPGPTVMVVGGVHGNEPSSWHSVEVVRYWPITKGVVVSIPRANPTSIDANQRRIPEAKLDLNRQFPKPGQPAELAEDAHPLAVAIWDLVNETKPDWLLDCHEGFDFSHVNPKSVGSSIISDPENEVTRAMAQTMIDGVNALEPEPAHPFTLRGPSVAGSLSRAATDHLGIKAMTLETTTKNQRLPIRTRQHRTLMAKFFTQLEMLAEETSHASLVTSLVDADAIQVGLYDDGGVSGAGIPRITEQLAEMQDVRVVRIDGADVRSGATQGMHVVIFSGGSGSGQGNSLKPEGREKVREFVDQGGTYVGICAGGYLACDSFSWGVGLLNAKTKSPQWRRGGGDVLVEWTELGKGQLDREEASMPMRYHNGPIWEPHDSSELPPFEVIAWFREEVAENDTPVGIMVDSPAAVYAPFGQGQVMAFSCHPEQTAGGEQVVPRMIRLARERLAAGVSE